jgi:CheY-like chemotaxis protein
MCETSKTNNELLKENVILKQRIQELEISGADLKRTEEERRSLEKKLQHMDKKMDAIGTFARDIANDLNNLLMGIQGVAAVSLLDFEPFHPHYKNLRKIEEQVQNGVALTNQLLEFAREYRSEVTSTDMNAIIQKTSSIKEMLKEKIETGAGIIATGTETILLVDDEKDVREVGMKMLESMGYHVYVAASGQEAISIYMEKRNKIALVILDVIMPGISGGETYDRLKEIDSNVNVLLASGDSLHGRVQEILDRGCKGFLQKPFSFSQFSCKIREMLD